NDEASTSGTKNELEIAKLEESFHNWNIPIIDKDKVYKKRNFWEGKNYEIHMLEYCKPGTSNNKIITILEEDKLKEHSSKGYNFIHIGLIQVAVKPNFRIGINLPILLTLRDTRFQNFSDSLIGILESNCHDGPVFFNCYPNYAMNLKNEYTWQALKLQVRSDETIINEKYDPFEIIYRIYYKITKVNYDFKALRQSSKEETIIMHANLKRSNIQTPRRLRHEELKSKMLEEWVIPDGIEEPQIQNTRIREIIREGPDVRIRMNRSHSLRIPDNVETISHRNSIDNSSIENIDDIVGIDNRRPHIATAVYKSPSEFDPRESQVMTVIIKEEPFEIDKEWIRQDFNADYNKPLRDWYFTNHSENEVIRLRELFYDFMKENRISLYFFDWYVNYYSKPDKKLCPLTKSTVVWKTSSGSVIESEYPPKETIKIPIGKDLEVEATPYKD
ncbi:hypothetical protein S245_000192, partial [Arachis hypogaea]